MVSPWTSERDVQGDFIIIFLLSYVYEYCKVMRKFGLSAVQSKSQESSGNLCYIRSDIIGTFPKNTWFMRHLF